jgi:hypothetical protein
MGGEVGGMRTRDTREIRNEGGGGCAEWEAGGTPRLQGAVGVPRLRGVGLGRRSRGAWYRLQRRARSENDPGLLTCDFSWAQSGAGRVASS